MADAFIASRSDIGVSVIRRWAKRLPAGGTVIDIGCGTGVPISEVLIAERFQVSGVDASPKLVAAFRRRFPTTPVVCEPAEDSQLFGRSFDGAVAVGLLFLLRPGDQEKIIHRVASALKPNGCFLFSAPHQACAWNDVLTKRLSVSLGMEAYRHILDAAGMHLRDSYVDEGENHYFDAVKRTG